MILYAAANIDELFFSLSYLLDNVFYWVYTGWSTLIQLKAWHRKTTRHHLNQCQTIDAYMHHRASLF